MAKTKLEESKEHIMATVRTLALVKMTKKQEKDMFETLIKEVFEYRKLQYPMKEVRS